MENIRGYEPEKFMQLLQKMPQGISLSNMPGTEKWADIKVFEGEPYTPDTYVPEFLSDYLVGLEYLRQTFNRDKNMDVYNALINAMPVGLFFALYDAAN